jgi:predicted nucleotidyltransferase
VATLIAVNRAYYAAFYAAKALSELLLPRERQAMEAFVASVSQRYPDRIQDVILFGSKARGDGHPDSDIDVLILTDDDDWRFSHAISTLAARISLNYDVLLAPRVVSRSRWRRSILYSTIRVDGISLTPTAAR